MACRRLFTGVLGLVGRPEQRLDATTATIFSSPGSTWLSGLITAPQRAACSQLGGLGSSTRHLDNGGSASSSGRLSAHIDGVGLLHGITHSQTASSTQYLLHVRSYASNVYVSLSNLRDNPGATKKRIRVGRGNSSRRGNYAGRGLNGHNARSGGGPHLLYDGGQLGLLKFPVRRERPPYEVLYTQLGLGRLLEYLQLGLLDHDRLITMKDLQDSGCVSRSIKYGVMLYGTAPIHFPVHLQITACDPQTKAVVEAAGGSVTRVYYEEEGLRALLHPGLFTRKNLPLPPSAHSWHPRYNGKFDAVGQIPPAPLLPQLGAQASAL